MNFAILSFLSYTWFFTIAEETAIYFRHHGIAGVLVGVLSADFEVRWTNLSSSQLTCRITIDPTLINVGGYDIVLTT